MSEKIKNKNNEISPKVALLIMALVAAPIIGLLVWGQINKPGTKALGALLDKPAPQFSFPGRNGNIFTNDNLKGKNIVLFFSDGLSCYPACWQQIAAFGTDKRFNGQDTSALSVVLESAEDWQKTSQKMDGIDKANIVFDTSAKASREYGMLNVPSSMHQGRLGHTYVIIDKQGIVRYVFDDPSMGIQNDKIYNELQKYN